jgi:hypothetical protein
MTMTDCSTRGIQQNGDAKPDNRVNGNISKKAYNTARCMVTESDETNNPRPAAASTNGAKPVLMSRVRLRYDP